MDQATSLSPTYNLWSEPWITAETLKNELVEMSLSEILTNADTLRTVFDPSPLVVMGIHRLLVAILQDTFQPRRRSDLIRLWQTKRFDPERIASFGQQFANLFDLFSESQPFLQSADIPLSPSRDAKTVGYLYPDLPAGTAVTHYTHTYDDDICLCASCAAKGLVMVPAFASSGGAGIKPSINGVPPIYILPGGHNYFESLTASLTIPEYQSPIAAADNDQVWWRRQPLVEKKGIVSKVGYLHSLTFPARRVRLHPILMQASCTRCGQRTTWGVRTMIFEMGESRPDDATLWQDPFAAYVLPSKKAEGAEPRPLRPKEGQAYWREFSTLFLADNEASEVHNRRPRLLDLLDDLNQDSAELPFADEPIPFRLIGVRTDGKMKYFEWQEEGFLVPPQVLHDPRADFVIRRSLKLADSIANQLALVFRTHFGGSKDRERFSRLKANMITAYWRGLAAPFRELVLQLGASKDYDTASASWAQQVVDHARRTFRTAAEETGTDGSSLRAQVQAISHCYAATAKILKAKLAEEESH
jgi:CRISPR system Cascade subunit CasA